MDINHGDSRDKPWAITFDSGEFHRYSADSVTKFTTEKSVAGEVFQLTEEKLREVFDKADKDGNGRLDKGEICEALESLGRCQNEIDAVVGPMGEQDILDFEAFKAADSHLPNVDRHADHEPSTYLIKSVVPPGSEFDRDIVSFDAVEHVVHEHAGECVVGVSRVGKRHGAIEV